MGASRLLVLFLLYSCAPVCNGEARDDLLNALFRNYNKDVRPVRDTAQKIYVEISVRLRQILSVDTKLLQAKVSVWVTQLWHDHYLYWDTEEYQQDQLHVPFEKIWNPSTIVTSNLEMNVEDVERHMPVLLRPTELDGEKVAEVKAPYPAIYTPQCHISVEYFPWDHIICNLTFGSLSRPIEYVDYNISANGVDTQYMLENLEWVLVRDATYSHLSTTCELVDNPFANTSSQSCYRFVTVTMKIKRKAGFFKTTLFYPAIIVVQVALLGMFSLSQSDGERNEKVTLGVTAILAISIVLLVVGDVLPTASDPVPKINIYVLELILLIVGAMVLSIFIIHLQYHSKSGKPVPKWAKCLLLICVRRKKTDKDAVKRQIMSENDVELEGGPKIDSTMVQSTGLYFDDSVSECEAKLYKDVLSIRNLLYNTVNSLRDVDDAEVTKKEWSMVINRLDWMGFFLFSLTAWYLTISYLISAELQYS